MPTCFAVLPKNTDIQAMRLRHFDVELCLGLQLDVTVDLTV